MKTQRTSEQSVQERQQKYLVVVVDVATTSRGELLREFDMMRKQKLIACTKRSRNG